MVLKQYCGSHVVFADKKVQVLQAPVVFCTLITMWPAMLAGCVIVCIVRCPFATVWCLLTQWQEVVLFWRAGRKRRFACIITDAAASKQGAGEEHTRRAYGVSVRSWCSDTANSVRESESWLLSSAHLSVFSFMISLWARKIDKEQANAWRFYKSLLQESKWS